MGLPPPSPPSPPAPMRKCRRKGISGTNLKERGRGVLPGTCVWWPTSRVHVGWGPLDHCSRIRGFVQGLWPSGRRSVAQRFGFRASGPFQVQWPKCGSMEAFPFPVLLLTRNGADVSRGQASCKAWHFGLGLPTTNNLPGCQHWPASPASFCPKDSLNSSTGTTSRHSTCPRLNPALNQKPIKQRFWACFPGAGARVLPHRARHRCRRGSDQRSAAFGALVGPTRGDSAYPGQ